MKIKKFINKLNCFDDNKVVYIKCLCIDKENNYHECISGIQPQDIKVNSYFSRITLASKHNENKEYSIVNTIDKITGMTVKEVKEYILHNFSEDDIIYTDGFGAYKLKNRDIHEFHDSILIGYDVILDKINDYKLVNRNSDYNTIPKKMTVGDLKNWLNQFDNDIPVMIEGYNLYEQQFYLTKEFLKKGKYTTYNKKNNEKSSIDTIFIG